MKTIEFFGLNRNFGISEQTNHRTCDNEPFVYPPLKLNYPISQILCYYSSCERTILITNTGCMFALGNNKDGKICTSSPRQIFNHFTQIELKDANGKKMIPISVVCSGMCTLYLVLGPTEKSTNRLVLSVYKSSSEVPFVLNTGQCNPISLYGGSGELVAIDSDGAILYVHSKIIESPQTELKHQFLPGNEKAVSVAFSKYHVNVLAASGRNSELYGKEIISISGISSACFALTKDGKVFGRGDNYYGQIGIIGENYYHEFTELTKLSEYKIVQVYAGGGITFFQTSQGEVFACGSNEYGSLCIDVKPINYRTFAPTKTNILNPSFIAAGCFCAVVFTNYIPPNNPNKKATDVMQMPKLESSEEEEEEEVEYSSSDVKSSAEVASMKSKIEELEQKLQNKDKEIKKMSEKFAKEKTKLKHKLSKQKKQFTEQIEELKKEKNNSESSVPIKKKNASVPRGKQIKILNRDDIDNLEQIEEISDGSSGRVYKVAKKVFYALKVMKIDATQQDLKKFLSEYEIMNMLDHPNIMKTFGIFLSDEKQPPSILLEFCSTSITELIKEKSLSNVNIVFYIYQIVEGMKYIHFFNVIHRDLKPSNILVDDDGIVKIGDFGISKLMSTEEQTMTYGVGTLSYMVPEIIDNDENYDEKVDVYSFGVVLFFILSGGELPKIKMSSKMKGKKPSIPANFTDFARQLIEKCWNFKSKDRPSFDEILKELDENNYMLIKLTKSEVNDIKIKVEQHKEKIPQY